MVIPVQPARPSSQRASLVSELLIALAILSAVLLPVAYSTMHEQKLARAYYHRAIAMEIVDGEMEILRAGEWRAYPAGRQNFTVRATAAKNLPAGNFTLILAQNRIRLEWRPSGKAQGGNVYREVQIPK